MGRTLERRRRSCATQGAGPGGNITIQASAVVVRRGGSISDTTLDQGNSGSIYITANDVSVTQGTINHTSIGSGTASSGNAGSVNLTVGTLELQDGRIEDQSSGPGSGGDVNIRATGSVSMTETIPVADTPSNGSNIGPTRTGVSTLTSNGPGGNINIDAASLTMLAGAQLDLTNNGSSQEGNLAINAKNILLDGSGPNPYPLTPTGTLVLPTGKTIALHLFDTTNVEDNNNSGSGGGNVTVTAETLAIRNNAYISASTYSSANGGNISIRCPNVIIDGAKSGDFTGLVAVTGAQLPDSIKSGDGGSIQVDASGGTVKVTAGGVISADSFGSGNGGSVSIIANQFLLAGDHAALAAQTHFPTMPSPSGGVIVAGNGGSLSVHALEVDVVNTALISASSEGSGIAGDLSINAGTLHMNRGGLIASSGVASGNAGTVTINLTRPASTEPSLTVNSDSLISTANQSSTSANAGDIVIDARGSIDLTGGVVTSQTNGGGGTVSITTQANLSLDNAMVSATTQRNGDISLYASGLMLLSSSNMSAKAALQGGQISINSMQGHKATGSQFVLLNDSVIDGRSGVQADVRVMVGSQTTFLQSTDSQILSTKVTLPPETHLAGELISLPGMLQTNLELVPVCAPHIGGDFSSFIITGRGGTPPDPAGWFPDYFIQW